MLEWRPLGGDRIAVRDETGRQVELVAKVGPGEYIDMAANETWTQCEGSLDVLDNLMLITPYDWSTADQMPHTHRVLPLEPVDTSGPGWPD